MKKIFFLSLATGFGLGYSPIMPGTTGSIPGFILVCFFLKFSWPVQIFLIILSFFTGVWVSNNALKYFHEQDPGAITIDEIVSLPVTFFLIPLSPATILTGFIINRILDIIKPFPAYRSQALPKGWGIMTDDLITGIYSNIILQVVIAFL